MSVLAAVLVALLVASNGALAQEGPVTRPRLFPVPLDELSAGEAPPPRNDSPSARSRRLEADTAANYRSIAVLASSSHEAPLTENQFVSGSTPFTEAPATVPPPVVEPEGVVTDCSACYSDGNQHGLLWSRPLVYQPLPSTLLWDVPFANQREPQLYAKFTNARDESTIDTAIGAQFGLARFSPEGLCREGIQLDGFAVVFTRFNDNRLLTAVDYRAGVPLTYAKGPWQAKLSYEHTSTHLGDEFMAASGRQQVAHVRDEIVLGLARRLGDHLRLYGQFGYSFLTSDVIGDDRDRYDLGIEWSYNYGTGWKGQPFAAADFDIRSDQDHHVNTTLQVGWQWKNNHAARIAFEFYDGRSPYGQFFRDREHWVGVVGAYSW